jgi:signal transduction histidine kinase
VGFNVEHWETEVETATLHEQLRHADRLATVGQLAAGVAHELNEPLGAVLFAELIEVRRSSDIRETSTRSARRSMREIIRKLMIHATGAAEKEPVRSEPDRPRRARVSACAARRRTFAGADLSRGSPIVMTAHNRSRCSSTWSSTPSRRCPVADLTGN